MYDWATAFAVLHDILIAGARDGTARSPNRIALATSSPLPSFFRRFAVPAAPSIAFTIVVPSFRPCLAGSRSDLAIPTTGRGGWTQPEGRQGDFSASARFK